ncbi:MAG TPA: chemotaxis protein CheB [Dokdonella sp.]
MAEHASGVAVALLYETRERGAHLREALTSLGAPIVYEASTHTLDRDALERSQANVVVVNLDAQQDPGLDDVYGLLADQRYRVVFNDGEVSSALSGWDHARWARHLAAKILGADIDPPRPVDAEPVPAAAPRSEAAYGNGERAFASVAALPAVVDAGDAADAQASALALSLASVWSLDDPATSAHATLESAPLEPEGETIELSAEPLSLDLDDLIDMPEVPHRHDAPALFDEIDDAGAPHAHAASGDAAALAPFDLAEIDDLLTTFDATPAPPSHDAVSDAFADYDFDVGEEAMPAPPVPEVPAFVVGDGLMLTLDDEPSAEEAPAAADLPVRPAAAAARDPSVAVPTNWSLEDMIDDLGDLPPGPPPTGPADFGIEKLSAEEFLAPSAEAQGAPADVGLDAADFSFELIPLEEAVAPTAVESAAHENWLDPDSIAAKTRVRRVWVLGASIGGPESVREFLAELPRDYPALFLLAQHLGGEFVDMMTRQLAKATPLTIRTPTHGERVGHGEVVVVPTTHRLIVDAEGVIVLERNAEEAPYSPSIDQVLRDVADRFGAGAGAIVFSGMSTDAVEGSQYLAGKGGRVYVQNPDTCVVSSMVDAVVEAGVVSFIGSPKELAEKLLAEPK